MLIGGRAAVRRLIELRGAILDAPLLPRRVRGVADDRQQPGTRVDDSAWADALEMLERSQTGVLHHVFGVLGIAHQITRQGVRRIEMRSEHVLEWIALAS